MNMNIYIISENANFIVEEIKESMKGKNENDLNKNNDNLDKNIVSFWEFTSLEGSLPNKLNLLLNILKKKIEACTIDSQQFKEIYIIKNDGISQDNINELFDKLNDILDESGEYYHPFIIFLTKEEISVNNQDYYNLDLKKISFLLYSEEQFPLSDLIFKLIQIFSYYNELGDEFEINGYPYYSISDYNNYPTYLNILIMGRSQSGKSTFINLLLDEKRAKEGGNNCGCSQKPQKYKILNYPIRLYDTIGFGDDDKNIKEFINYFKKMDDQMNLLKEKIHLVLYFIDGGAGNKISKKEKILLKEIQKRNLMTFFIVTKFNHDPKKNNKKYNNELKKIYKSLTSLVGNNYVSSDEEKALDRFIGVNLVKKSSDNSAFGFESIIKKIYTYLKEEYKIIFEIKEQYMKNNSLKVSMEELFSKLKDTFFFNHIKHYKEIEEKYEQEAKKVIMKANKKMCILGLFPIIDDISHYYLCKNLNKDIKNIFQIKKELNIKKNETNNLYYNIENTTPFLHYSKINQFNIKEKGEELIQLYKQKYEEEKYNYILILIDSISQAFQFFEQLCKKLNI